MNRLARASELINKALDRGHVRLALRALSYIATEHHTSMASLPLLRAQFVRVLPALMTAADACDERGIYPGHAGRRAEIISAAEPILRRLLRGEA